MRWVQTVESSCRGAAHRPAGPLRAACALAGFAFVLAGIPAAAQEEQEARRLRAIGGNQVLDQTDAASRAAARADGQLATVASDPARYGLARESVDAGRVVAVRPDRSVVADLAGLSRVEPGTFFVERVRPQAVEAAAPAALAAHEGAFPATDYKLGFEITAFEAQSNRPLDTDAWARDSTGLGIQGSTGNYVGHFNVALVLKTDPSDRSTLASPVTVSVTARGATIDPRPVAISQLGLWHEVSIAVPDVEHDTYDISVSADPTNPGDPVPLAVMRPEARIWSTPQSIIGWGIGESTVFIEADGLREPAELPVALRVVNGSLSADRVTLDAAGHAEVKLRSTRERQAIVEIMSSPLRGGEPLVIPFTAPWWFLGAAVAGGLAGAFLRGRGRQHWIKALAIGVLTAVIMCLAYAVGVDWPAKVLATAGIPKAAEAAVFVLGAVGALLGVSAMLPKQPET